MQNLTIDYSTDTKGRILSAAYSETGEFNGNLTYVYDNYGNVAAQEDDDGDITKAILINPNNGAIDTKYNPDGIDDPYTYRARDGFMSIGSLWANNDDGTVYMQGHPVIPNPWGDTDIIDSTTTTTTGNVTKQVSKESAIDCLLDLCEKLHEDFQIKFERGIVSGDYVGKKYEGQDKKLEDMDCDELQKGMSWAENDYKTYVEKFGVDFGDLSNPIGVANKIYDYVYDQSGKAPFDTREHRAKHHAIYDACQYWQIKQEYDRRLANGEC
jgi:YD repeat-containing protein